MTDRTGAELIQDFLATYEIPFVFGNPGTTETTFLAAVAASKATYILSFTSSSAVGIAAGYALITGKPSTAKYAIPCIFVCFVNHEYRLLKELWCNAMGTTIETTQFVGMDFDNPNLNMQGIAEGFGARTEKNESLQSIGQVLQHAHAHQGPSFLVIDREP